MKPLPFILLFSICCSATAAEIYKWVDEKGNVHFGDRPSTSAAEKVQIKKSGNGDSSYSREMEKQRRLLEVYTEERKENEAKQVKAKQEQEKRNTNCSLAKKNLAETKNAGFLYEDTDDPFNPKVLNAQERLKATAKAEAAVKTWCK